MLLHNFDKNIFGNYKDILFNLFNKHTLLIEKYVRVNEAHFVTKDLHKAIYIDQSCGIFAD